MRKNVRPFGLTPFARSRSSRPLRKGLAGFLTLVLLSVTALIASTSVSSAATAPAKKQTIVTLTFDDSNVDQLNAVTPMNTAGIKGTFYTVSGFINQPNYFTLTNLKTISAAGNEIAGHTVTHPDLTTIPADEATRQICNDRVNLTNWGFTVTDFAYPFASVNPAVETLVKNCGYNSARGLGDIQSRFGCSGCPYAESIPPVDPYYTQALDEVDSTWTLADLEKGVTNAEKAGGWVQYTFHHICANACDPLAITPTLFTQFVKWLAPRATSNNTVTKTVAQVIGGTVKPAINGPIAAPAPGQNAIQNPSLETASGTPGLPQCWMAGSYGTNTPTFATVTPGRTGATAEQVTMTGYSDGDAKLLPALDLGGCSPGVTVGHTYSLRAWYTSTAVTQVEVYLRTGIGTWTYWTAGPWLNTASAWTQAEFTTPPIPAGATGISYGLNIFSNGEITTDDYAMYDSVGAPPLTAAVTNTPATTSFSKLAAPKVALSKVAPTQAKPTKTVAKVNKTRVAKLPKQLKPGQHFLPLIPALTG